MCVVALAWRPQGWRGPTSESRGPHLVLIANRDEFHRRASASLDVLDNSSLLVGGRDLERRGGWLWATAKGRLAAVTNVRAPRSAQELAEAAGGPPLAERARRDSGPLEGATESRGSLVATFTTSNRSTDEYLRDLRQGAALYGRFNLLVFDGVSLGYASNVPSYTSRSLPPGVYSLSNGSLDTPWPKTQRVQGALVDWLTSADAAAGEVGPLFEALGDDKPVADDELPDTGVGLAVERMLAPPFIRSPAYGTRCSSVVMYSDDEMMFAERRFGADGECTGETVVTIPRGHRSKR
jgi:uncharacterized protein with NRDE domain